MSVRVVLDTAERVPFGLEVVVDDGADVWPVVALHVTVNGGGLVVSDIEAQGPGRPPLRLDDIAGRGIAVGAVVGLDGDQ